MWRGRSPFDHDRLRQERGRRLRRPLTTTVLVQSAQPPAASRQPPAASRPAVPAEVTTPASTPTANDYGQNAAQNYRTPSFARPLHPVHRRAPRRLIWIEISQVRPGIRWPIRGRRSVSIRLGRFIAQPGRSRAGLPPIRLALSHC